MRRVVGILIAAAAIAPAAHGATVPRGFADDEVVQVNQPTSIAFLSGGNFLVTSQRGTVSHVRTGVPTPALNLSDRVCSDSERGLLGVAVDPQFAQNDFVYLFYTHDRFGGCSRGSARVPANRVSRFTMNSAGMLEPASEKVLIDNVPSFNGNHNGGDLQFGKDGFLYVTIGDGGCDYAGNSGCGGANDATRDRHALLGKVLRITREGEPAPNNPFPNGPRCALVGVGAPGTICAETYAWGLRNPFRIAFDPDVAGTSFYINDVGQNVWEEINRGISGADYGWNAREGRCATGSTTNCPAPPAGVTDPIFAYRHTDGCSSISGGAFVPNNMWAGYDNVYLYADYECGRIFALRGTASTVFASNAGGVVHLAFGPVSGAQGQALYYTTFRSGGEVRKISRSVAEGPARPPARCRVPRVRGLNLSGARPLLRTNGCTLGRVRYNYSNTVRRGIIIAQSPLAGRNLARGAKVNVTVSRGRRP